MDNGNGYSERCRSGNPGDDDGNDDDNNDADDDDDANGNGMDIGQW